MLDSVKLCIRKNKSKTASNVLEWQGNLAKEKVHKTKGNISWWHENPCQNNPNCCHLCFPCRKRIVAK
jgi:hypothetical protein